MSGRLRLADRRLRQRRRVPRLGADLRPRAARAGLPHLPRRQDALRRPRPAARLRGAADHRHLPGRLRLDAQLGRARRSGSTGGTTTWLASSRRASPRPPTSSTSTTRSPSRPSAGWPSTRARSGDGRPLFLCVSFTHPHDPYAIPRSATGTATATTRSICRACRRPARARWTRTAAGWRGSSTWTAVEITEADVRRARHAYYGEISYVDDQVGRLLATLRAVRPRGRHGRAVHRRPRRDAGRARPVVQDALLRVGGARAADRPGAGALRAAPRWRRRSRSWTWRRPCSTSAAASSEPAPLERRREPRCRCSRAATAGAPHRCSPSTPPRARSAPILMVRDGACKLIWSEADPPLLFDLAPTRTSGANLAAEPDARRDLARLRRPRSIATGTRRRCARRSWPASARGASPGAR